MMKGKLAKRPWIKQWSNLQVRKSLSIAFLTGLTYAFGMIPFPGPVFLGSSPSLLQAHAAAEIPQEYQGKQMPAGWGTDPKVIAAGKAIYEGNLNPRIKCVDCHGENGKPTRKGRGALDLSDPAESQKPDDFFFWRISEGARRTKMQAWKTKLTEEQRWQVIAYIRTLAHQ